jgi:hypothetical protein
MMMMMRDLKYEIRWELYWFVCYKMTCHKYSISSVVSKIVCDGQCVLCMKRMLHLSPQSSLETLISFFCFSKCLGSYAHSRAHRNTCWSSSKMCVIVPDCNPNWNVLTNFSSTVPTIKHKIVLHYSTF